MYARKITRVSLNLLEASTMNIRATTTRVKMAFHPSMTTISAKDRHPVFNSLQISAFRCAILDIGGEWW